MQICRTREKQLVVRGTRRDPFANQLDVFHTSKSDAEMGQKSIGIVADVKKVIRDVR